MANEVIDAGGGIMVDTGTPAPKPKAKPVAKKAPAKKPVAKAAPKASANGKPGLRKPQLAVLKILAKSNRPLTRAEIAAKGNLDVASLTGYIGSIDPAKRKYNDETYFPTLVTLGHVRHRMDEEKGVTHELTAKGKAEAAKAPKE